MPFTVARVLEDQADAAINDWLERVDAEPEIVAIEMSAEERSAHLHAVFRDLVVRLREELPLGTPALMSDAAYEHGSKRRDQGYTPAMMVNESRMLQVSIFETLQKNIRNIDTTLLLAGIMTIADEVDSQLAQAMSGYLVQAQQDEEPVDAFSAGFANARQVPRSPDVDGLPE